MSDFTSLCLLKFTCFIMKTSKKKATSCKIQQDCNMFIYCQHTNVEKLFLTMDSCEFTVKFTSLPTMKESVRLFHQREMKETKTRDDE